MGHANLSNISKFFVRRLYAKGTLTISECVEALVAAGETLHASEGEYEDYSMLTVGLMDILSYLTKVDPTQHGYSGPEGGGPWVEPVWGPWLPASVKISKQAQQLLQACEDNPTDQATHQVAADRLEDEGYPLWSRYVRTLLRQRILINQWIAEEDEDWEWGEKGSEGEDFNTLARWQFAKGWRHRYADIPLLGDVTH